MRTHFQKTLRIGLLLILALTLLTGAAMAVDPTEEPGTKMIDCPDCGGSTACMTCYGLDEACEDCGGSNVCAACGGAGYVQSPSRFFNSALSLLPPVIAIALALITKEVYSSLFVGIVVGGLLYANFSFEGTVLHVFNDGIAAVLSDSYNVGILIFLVILGAMVSLMNKAGGSAAFGRWAKAHIKSRVGAQLATIVLGCLIFIDDYFNCLTVGSVMRPITDKHNISRAKLSYLIDATAAPICIIAPISSWAAAVAGFAEEGQGLNLFIRAIPFNFYALLTIVMMVGMTLMRVEYGPMARYERNAEETGDLFSGPNPYAMMDEEVAEDKGRVLDLVMPIAVLVVCCVVGMIYSGGFFSGVGFVEAFSGSDASVGLMLGSAFALVFAFVYYSLRRAMSFKDMMSCIPDGFKAMDHDPDLCLEPEGHDGLSGRQVLRPGFRICQRREPADVPAGHRVCHRLRPGLRHRHQLGHLRYPDPHCPERLPHGGPPGHRVHFRLHGRRCLRRPLLSHLGYHHYGFCRRAV